MVSPGKEMAMNVLENLFKVIPNDPQVIDAHDVVIYGAGDLGKLAYNHLKYIGKNPMFFIDRSAKVGDMLYDLDVYNTNNAPYKNKWPLLVATASHPYTDISNSLVNLGFTNVFSFYDYAQQFNSIHPINNGWFAGKLSDDDMNGMRFVMDSLCDNESRASYLQAIEWRLTRRDLIFTDAPVIKDNRYFIEEITNVIREDEVFLDIGAYDGRVLDKFLSITNNKIKHAYLLEPDLKNFTELSKRMVGRQGVTINDTVVLDCDGTIDFCDGFGMTSKVCGIKEIKKSCKKIDSLSIKPTFVKIHAEGGELKIVKGAINTFTKYRPIITITLYHSRDGLWEIQKTLIDMLRDYKFFHRMHSWMGTGTVIYCIPKERYVNE